VTEVAGVVLRAAYAACAMLVFGSLLCLHLPPRAQRDVVAAWRGVWLRRGLLLSLAALALALGVLALQAVALTGGIGGAGRLLTETRFGAVWLARQALMLWACACLWLAVARRGLRLAPPAALLGCGLALALAPLSSHSAALEPALPALSAQVAHVLSAAAWWGALPALAALLAAASDGSVPLASAAEVFRRFSRLALPLVGSALAAGAALAFIHVERWPALIATRYGVVLLAKLAALACALVLAAKLRRELLPALLEVRSQALSRRCARWIAAEWAVGLLVVAAAVLLAQSVPARHDAIGWWLPFRLSIAATWDAPWTQLKVWSGAGVLVLAVALGVRARRDGRHARRLALGAAAAVASAAAIALPALSVDAYPDTYRRPSVAYQALSVTAGAELFAAHCTACHGRSGRGDGERAAQLALPPADLTAPHTALHTAGDLFWWLTHGKSPGVMPGFGAQLGEAQRWDLINFLRTLAAGHQARILEPRVARGRPWLGAVDFAFVDQHDVPGTLRDYRGRSAVLLVFFKLPASNARLAQLACEHVRLRAAGVEIVAVPLAGAALDGAPLPYPVAVDGADETARTYALLRRTLTNPDARDRAPLPAHMEMLVDRFGYIRARWLPAEGPGWENLDALVEQANALAREPQILPAPDEHVH
jgi:putative copper resistance protein D